MRYSPSGIAVLEFCVSVDQAFLGVKSRGRFDILVVGDTAGALEHKLRIGLPVRVTGKLWLREYRHKKGFPVKEIKIIADNVAVEAVAKPKTISAKAANPPVKDV